MHAIRIPKIKYIEEVSSRKLYEGSVSTRRFHLEPSQFGKDWACVSTRPVPFGTDARNCAGDICLAGEQENNRIAEEKRQSLFFEL